MCRLLHASLLAFLAFSAYSEAFLRELKTRKDHHDCNSTEVTVLQKQCNDTMCEATQQGQNTNAVVTLFQSLPCNKTNVGTFATVNNIPGYGTLNKKKWNATALNATAVANRQWLRLLSVFQFDDVNGDGKFSDNDTVGTVFSFQANSWSSIQDSVSQSDSSNIHTLETHAPSNGTEVVSVQAVTGNARVNTSSAFPFVPRRLIPAMKIQNFPYASTNASNGSSTHLAVLVSVEGPLWGLRRLRSESDDADSDDDAPTNWGNGLPGDMGNLPGDMGNVPGDMGNLPTGGSSFPLGLAMQLTCDGTNGTVVKSRWSGDTASLGYTPDNNTHTKFSTYAVLSISCVKPQTIAWGPVSA